MSRVEPTAQPVLTMHSKTVAQLAGVESVVAVQPSFRSLQFAIVQLSHVSAPPLPPEPELPPAPAEPLAPEVPPAPAEPELPPAPDVPAFPPAPAEPLEPALPA